MHVAADVGYVADRNGGRPRAAIYYNNLRTSYVSTFTLHVAVRTYTYRIRIRIYVHVAADVGYVADRKGGRLLCIYTLVPKLN